MFRRVSRLQTLAAGTGLRRAVDAVSRRTAGKPDFRGVVLDRVPQAECAVSNTILDQLLEGAVAPAAAEITGFFRTAAKGGRSRTGLTGISAEGPIPYRTRHPIEPDRKRLTKAPRSFRAALWSYGGKCVAKLLAGPS